MQYNQQRTTIMSVVHVLIVAVMLVTAFFPNVFVVAKTLSSSDVYVPFSGDQSNWGSQVCKSMTAGGCDYFTSSEMAAAWGYLTSINAAGVGMNLIEPVIDLSNGQDLWKVEFVIAHAQGEPETHEAYAIMSEGLLDRVVSLDGILIVGGIPWN